jgi:hypothetical protein
MTSVTRFIRQVPVSTTYYSVPTGFLASPSAGVYEFQPVSSNVVGNYPPGYMTAATTVLSAALAAAGSTSTLVLRDMGKTVYTGVSSDSGVTFPSGFGWFRQVQLLKPAAITSAQGFIGGTNGNTFGVLGGNNLPDTNSDFFTFYIAVPLGGTLGGTLGLTAAPAPIAGGQM